VKNLLVEEVEEWIARLVKETSYGFIKSNALEKAVEEDIKDKMASWNWEINLEEPCLGLKQKNVAMATKGKMSVMVCYATMEEVVEKHIVKAIDLDKIKATVMETILKTQPMEERVTRRVEK
jgi:hypothetical protein